MKFLTVLCIALTLVLRNGLSAQNVGIGTASPMDKLHIAGNVRVDGLAGVGTRVVGADVNGRLQIVVAGTNGQVLTQTAGGPIFQTPTADWTIVGNAGTVAATNFIGTTDGIDFVTRTNNVERMRVTSTGMVGINTAAPNTRLHVAGNVRVGVISPLNTGAFPAFGPRIYFSGACAGGTHDSENSDSLWMARYNKFSDVTELRMNLSDNCDNSDAFVIQSGGFACAVTDYFRFEASGVALKIGGGAWTALSDRRLKQNVYGFTDGLEVLKQVRPVNFQYNGLAGTPDNGKVYTGVIAQELQAIAPYMVESTEEYLRVDPSSFTYILINAVKEQQVQIEALRTEVAALKAAGN